MVAPVVELYCPAGQVVHTVEPGKLVYEPALQTWQKFDPTVEIYCPAGH
jgi:hypothetical protein